MTCSPCFKVRVTKSQQSYVGDSNWEVSLWPEGCQFKPLIDVINLDGESEGNCLPHPHSTIEGPSAGPLTLVAPVELLSDCGSLHWAASVKVWLSECDQSVPEKESFLSGELFYHLFYQKTLIITTLPVFIKTKTQNVWHPPTTSVPFSSFFKGLSSLLHSLKFCAQVRLSQHGARSSFRRPIVPPAHCSAACCEMHQRAGGTAVWHHHDNRKNELSQN